MTKTAVDQVKKENKLRRTGSECGNGDEFVQRHQRGHEIVDKGGITAHIAHKSEIVEWHKDAVGADKSNPEVEHTESFVHHSPGHFGKPEIGSGKNGKDGGNSHNHVEMTDDEIGRVQIDVNGGLRKKESAYTATDKHGDEPKSKEGGGIDLDVRAIQTSQPDERDDSGGDGDGECREREKQRRKGIHAADEHVMSPNHPTEKTYGHHRVDDDFRAQQRLTQTVREHVRDNPDRRQNGDVHFRGPEEPEQVLPQKRRPAGVILQSVAHDQPGRDEETRSGHTIEEQK